MSWLGKLRTFLPQAIRGPVAVLYEKVATPGLREFHRKVAAEVASSLKSGRVLDVGTGPGHLLVEITGQNPDLELTGCDLSRKMLEIAEQTIEPVATVCVVDPASTDVTPTTAQTNPGVRLVRGDVGNLPFPDNTFVVVVSTLSIHHWRDPAEGIRECLRVTAPGGRCWIYDLRTDVPAREHAKLITSNWFGRLVLSWIFRFHGISSRRYQTSTLVSWLGHGAMACVDIHPAYLRLNIEKPADKSHDGTIASKSLSSVGSAALPNKE